MTLPLLCTTRFDPSLEAFKWNNAPDGSPSPYLLLHYQLDRVSHSTVFDYDALRHVCDDAVRSVNTPLKVIIANSLSRQPLTWPSAPGARRLSPLWEHHGLRFPSRATAL